MNLGPDGFTPLAPEVGGGCTPCMVCGGSQDRAWHNHPPAEAELITTALRMHDVQWERANRLEAERDRYRTAWKSAATRAGAATDRTESAEAVIEATRDLLDGWEHDGPDDYAVRLLIQRVRETLALGERFRTSREGER